MLLVASGIARVHADFKKTFSAVWKEREYRVNREPGPLETWAVLLQGDVAAASTYGMTRTEGNVHTDCYDTDIQDGRAKEPEPEKQKEKIWALLRAAEVLEVNHDPSKMSGRSSGRTPSNRGASRARTTMGAIPR